MTRFLFIAGHGNQRNGTFDPGATGYITKGEYRYMVQDLFPAIRRLLPSDADVVFYDKLKVSNYGNLQQIVDQYKADEVVEFHFDASNNSSARSGHVIIHHDYAPDKVDLALRDAIRSMVGVRYSHRGHTGISGRTDLYNVNDARNKGITYRLIELGFGTNRQDADIMVGQVNAYARALVMGLFGSVADVSDNGEIVKEINYDGDWRYNSNTGAWWVPVEATFVVGSEPIYVYERLPKIIRENRAPSQAQPGARVTVLELCRCDGYEWAVYRTSGGRLRYMPIKPWNGYANQLRDGGLWGRFV